MKGLLLFIRNNRIIYKVSIVSILILMLISVVQINPKEKNIVASEGADIEVVHDYYFRYDAALGKMYKVESTDTSGNGVEITESNRSEVVGGWSIVNKGGKNVLVLSNFNFTTNCKRALVCSSNTLIEVEEDTDNHIGITYNSNGVEGGTYAIKCENTTRIYSSSTTGKMGRLELEINDSVSDAIDGITINNNLEIENVDLCMNLSGVGQIFGVYVEGGYTKKLRIINSKLDINVTDKYSTECDVYGLYSIGKMELEESTIDIKVGKAYYATGIHKNIGGPENLIVNKCNININIKETVSLCAGIFANGFTTSYSAGIEFSSSVVDICLEKSDRLYGVVGTGGITVTGGIINVKLKGNTGIGMHILEGNNLNIIGGRATIQAEEKVISGYTIPSENVLVASKEYNGESIVTYNSSELSEYKYLELGQVYNYSLRYKITGASGHMVKVDSNGVESDITDTNLTSCWEIDADTKELTLKGLNFITNQDKALEIEGEATVKLANGTTSCIGSVNENFSYGIFTEKDLTIRGNGKLNISRFGGSGTGIFVGKSGTVSNLTIENANVFIRGIALNLVGMNVYGKIIINNTDLKLDFTTNSMATGITNNKGMCDISIENSNIDMNIISKQQTVGIFPMGGGLSCVNSKLNLQLESEKDCYGIYTYGSGTCLIKGGKLDMKISSSEEQRAIRYRYVQVDGGHNVIKLTGSNTGYGIHCDSYKQTAGFMRIDSDNEVGIYAIDGDIHIYDGTLEITSNQAMNKAPILDNENVAISEFEQGKNTGIKYTGYNENNISQYNHIIIEPTYFLKYEDGKLYKCNTLDDNNEPLENNPTGINIVDNKIELDGFVFTTSNRLGLVCPKGATINLSEGSENYISTRTSDTKLTRNNVNSVIYVADNNMNIKGSGKLNLISNVRGDNSGTYNDSKFIYGIYLKKGDLEVQNSKIYCDLVSSNINSIAYLACADRGNIGGNNTIMNISADVGTYKGIQAIYGNVTVKDSSIKLDTKSHKIGSVINNILGTLNGNIKIDNSQIIGSVMAWKTTGIGAEYGQLDIINWSDINIIENNKSMGEGGTSTSSYLIGIQSGKPMNIYNSDVYCKVEAVDKGYAIWSDGEVYNENTDEHTYNNGKLTITYANVQAYTDAPNGSEAIYLVDDVTIKDSSVNAMNTNSLAVDGYGMNVGGKLTVVGGYVKANGSKAAIKLTNESNLSFVQDDTYYTDVLCSSKSYNGATRNLYDIGQLAEYKYIEIGKIYSYYLKYSCQYDTFYKIINGNYRGISRSELEHFGISSSEVDGKKVVTLDNFYFITSANKGLEIDGDATISLVGESKINVTHDSGIGITGTGNVTLTGETIHIYANQVIDRQPTTIMGANMFISILKEDGEYINPSNLSDITKCTYIKIETIYYLKYNANDKTMYKVIGNTSSPITPEDLPGWRINAQDGTLILDGLHFATIGSYGLQCVEDTVIELAEGSRNSIKISDTVVGNNKQGKNAGIIAEKNITFCGKGRIDISNNTNVVSNKFYVSCIRCEGNLEIYDSEINTYMENGVRTYGIYTNSMDMVSGKIYVKGNNKINNGIHGGKNINIGTKENSYVPKINIDLEGDEESVGISCNYSDDWNDDRYANINIYNSDIDIKTIVTKSNIALGNCNCSGISANHKISISNNSKVNIIAESACTNTGTIKAINSWTRDILVDNSNIYIECKGEKYVDGLYFKKGLQIKDNSKVEIIIDGNIGCGIMGGAIFVGEVNSVDIDNSEIIIKETSSQGVGGIDCYGVVDIKNSKLDILSDNGYGIQVNESLIINDTVATIKGEQQAIGFYNFNSLNIDGIVEASTEYDGDLKVVDDISTNYANYKNIKIEKIIIPDIISVNITWSDMSYAYSPGTWNPDTHSFIDNGWTPKTTDGGKITVSNSGSNMPIKAIISYDKGSNINSSNNNSNNSNNNSSISNNHNSNNGVSSSNDNSNNNSDSNNDNNSNGNLGIDGKLVVYDENKNIINEGSVLDKKLIVRDSFITYLQLIEEPKELFERTSVGNITVTITE